MKTLSHPYCYPSVIAKKGNFTWGVGEKIEIDDGEDEDEVELDISNMSIKALNNLASDKVMVGKAISIQEEVKRK